MLERGRITSRQLIWLQLSAVLPVLAVTAPGIVAQDAGRDAWIISIVKPLLIMAVLWIPAVLAERFPDRTMVGYGRLLLGRWGGSILGVLLSLAFIFLSGIILREFMEVLISVFFESTPIVVLTGTMMLFSAWAVRSGIEVIARVNDALMLLFLLPVLGLIALGVTDFNLTNLTPVLAEGVGPLVQGFYHTIALFGLISLAFLTLFPTQNQAGHGYRNIALSMAAIGAANLFITASITGIMGPLAAIERFPLLEVVRYIRLQEGVIERLDALLGVLWLGGGFLQVTIFYYAAVVGMAESLGTRMYQSVSLPIGILIVIAALYAFPSSTHLQEVITRRFPPIFLAIEIGLPLLLLIVAFVRRRSYREM